MDSRDDNVSVRGQNVDVDNVMVGKSQGGSDNESDCDSDKQGN